MPPPNTKSPNPSHKTRTQHKLVLHAVVSICGAKWQLLKGSFNKDANVYENLIKQYT